MAENSHIEWTDHTFNPWMGCTKVSQGCKYCYAETLMDTRWGKVQWGPQGTRVLTSAANWRKPLAWNRKAEAEGVRYRVFCASLADVFEDREELRDWRCDLFMMIEATPNLDWLLLTKRPENVLGMVPREWTQWRGGVDDFPPNVWLGTSVEDQATADERIPHLLSVPASVRFLSCEPLLGPVRLKNHFGLLPGNDWADCLCDEIDPSDTPCITCEAKQEVNGIDWVICGGESGHGARPMQLEWARSLRDQCAAAGTAFFMKQLGGRRSKGGDLADMPEDLRIREFPKGRTE